MFSSDRNVGGVDLNISALIAFITIRERLSPNGVLGFIMPDSILFNKSFEGFRKMKITEDKKFYLNRVIRWNDKTKKPFDPVSIDFSEYFFSYNKPEDIEVLEKKDNINKIAFRNENSFNNQYSILTNEDYEEVKSVLGRNDYKFRSGISLVKGGYYLLKFIRKIDNDVSEFEYYECSGNRIKPSGKTIQIETDIVFPYIKTDNIQDNYINETSYYCIFPYPKGSKVPYSRKEIREKFPKFYKFFSSNEVQTAIDTASAYNKRIQNTENDVGIIRVGEYTYSDWFVATRDNTKSTFSVVGFIRCPWGESKQPIFDCHINYVSRNKENQPLTKEEADMLFKSFTRKGVKIYIKASADARTISSRLYNDIEVKEDETK